MTAGKMALERQSKAIETRCEKRINHNVKNNV